MNPCAVPLPLSAPRLLAATDIGPHRGPGPRPRPWPPRASPGAHGRRRRPHRRSSATSTSRARGSPTPSATSRQAKKMLLDGLLRPLDHRGRSLPRRGRRDARARRPHDAQVEQACSLRPSSRSCTAISMGEVVGIGVKIELDPVTGYIDVRSTVPGSPAEHAGIAPPDKIVTVDGKLYKGLGVDERGSGHPRQGRRGGDAEHPARRQAGERAGRSRQGGLRPGPRLDRGRRHGPTSRSRASTPRRRDALRGVLDRPVREGRGSPRRRPPRQPGRVVRRRRRSSRRDGPGRVHRGRAPQAQPHGADRREDARPSGATCRSRSSWTTTPRRARSC